MHLEHVQESSTVLDVLKKAGIKAPFLEGVGREGAGVWKIAAIQRVLSLCDAEHLPHYYATDALKHEMAALLDAAQAALDRERAAAAGGAAPSADDLLAMSKAGDAAAGKALAAASVADVAEEVGDEWVVDEEVEEEEVVDEEVGEEELDDEELDEEEILTAPADAAPELPMEARIATALLAETNAKYEAERTARLQAVAQIAETNAKYEAERTARLLVEAQLAAMVNRNKTTSAHLHEAEKALSGTKADCFQLQRQAEAQRQQAEAERARLQQQVEAERQQAEARLAHVEAQFQAERAQLQQQVEAERAARLLAEAQFEGRLAQVEAARLRAEAGRQQAEAERQEAQAAASARMARGNIMYMQGLLARRQADARTDMRYEECAFRVHAAKEVTAAVQALSAYMIRNRRYDPRFQVALQDGTKNLFLDATASLDHRYALSISCEALLIHQALTYDELLLVGDLMHAFHRSPHPKHLKYVGGGTHMVHTYYVEDREHMRAMIRDVVAAHGRPRSDVFACAAARLGRAAAA